MQYQHAVKFAGPVDIRGPHEVVRRLRVVNMLLEGCPTVSGLQAVQRNIQFPSVTLSSLGNTSSNVLPIHSDYMAVCE